MCKVLVQGCVKIVRVNQLSMISIVETPLDGHQEVKLGTIISYNGHERVDASGFIGGIYLYWKTLDLDISALVVSP